MIEIYIFNHKNHCYIDIETSTNPNGTKQMKAKLSCPFYPCILTAICQFEDHQFEKVFFPVHDNFHCNFVIFSSWNTDALRQVIIALYMLLYSKSGKHQDAATYPLQFFEVNEKYIISVFVLIPTGQVIAVALPSPGIRNRLFPFRRIYINVKCK